MSDTRETLCTIFVVDNFSLICRHSSVSFSVEDNPFGDDATKNKDVVENLPLIIHTNKVENPHNGPSALLVLKSNWFPINNGPCK